MVASGELQSVKVGHLRRIPVEVIDAYIASLIEEAA
jgi:excisionase family DNA binding protein